jgi:hypothetical protein
LARGEFFKWMPHDDECHPSLLRGCIETFEDASAHTVLVCARSQIINETKRVVHVSRLKMNSSPKPFSRLASLISNRDYPHAIFGLIRSKALRQTRLMGVVHADHILLAELALLGSFVEIPANLQQWRIHSRSALKINRTSRQLLSWHDPKGANSRIILPHWLAWDLEYFRAIRHIPLSGKERLICYGVVSWLMCARWFQVCRNTIALRSRLKRTVTKLSRRPA